MKLFTYLPSEHKYARCIVQGIRAALRENPGVTFQHCKLVSLPERSLLEKLKCYDGGIAFISSTSLDDTLSSLGKPIINVSGALKESKNYRLLPDNRALGRRAAEHLINKGYQKIAFVGVNGRSFSRDRHEGCRLAAEAYGLDVSYLTHSVHDLPVSELEDETVKLGVVGCHDAAVRYLMDELVERGVPVPSRMGFIGMDDAEELCEGGRVSLSSLRTNGEQVGIHAVQSLIELSRGKKVEREMLVAPGSIVERGSSSEIVYGDPVMADALRYIQEHAGEGLQVAELAAALNVSLSSIYKKFSLARRSAPHQEIRAVQMERAKRLLRTSVLLPTEIARKCGFDDTSYFFRVFRKETGLTPGSYRKSVHLHRGPLE